MGDNTQTRPGSSGNVMKTFHQMPFGSPEPSCRLALARAILLAGQLTTTHKALTRCITSQPCKLLVHNAAQTSYQRRPGNLPGRVCANSAKAVRLRTVCIIFCYVLSCSAAAGTVSSIHSVQIYACAGSGTIFGMSTHTKLNICMWEAVIGRAQSQAVRTKKSSL